MKNDEELGSTAWAIVKLTDSAARLAAIVARVAIDFVDCPSARAASEAHPDTVAELALAFLAQLPMNLVIEGESGPTGTGCNLGFQLGRYPIVIALSDRGRQKEP